MGDATQAARLTARAIASSVVDGTGGEDMALQVPVIRSRSEARRFSAGVLGGECPLGEWPLVQIASLYAGSLVGVVIV